MQQPLTHAPTDFLIEPAVRTSPAPRPAPSLPGPVMAEAVEEPAPRSRGFLGRLAIAEWLLKHRDTLLAQIDAGHEVEVILVDLLLVALLPTACYGLVTGLATGNWVRMLTNP